MELNNISSVFGFFTNALKSVSKKNQQASVKFLLKIVFII